MGWLWVEGTPMKLPLRALNLRQAANLRQAHPFALGFTLSNSQDRSLATFWVIIATCREFSPLVANSVRDSRPLEGILRFSWNARARYPDRP